MRDSVTLNLSGIRKGYVEKNIDFSILLNQKINFANYAGLILEMIGYTRWQNFSTTKNIDSAIWITDNENLEEIKSISRGPIIVEFRSGQQASRLPCSLKISPDLEGYCAQTIGLYKHLDNYNGIKGITADYTAYTSFKVKRSQPQKRCLLTVDPKLFLEAPSVVYECRGIPLVFTEEGKTVVSVNGNIMYLGLPIFSILASHLTSPLFPETHYNFSEPVYHLFRLLEVLLNKITGPGVLKVSPWPNNDKGVLSIRHDLDRLANITEMCSEEKRLKLKPTVHVLSSNIPNKEEVESILQIDGEIGLHSQYLHDLEAEIMSIEEKTESKIKGNSAHGGNNSDGWQGYYNIEAANNQNLLYTELLSEMHIFPHRIPDFRRPGDALVPLAMPHHISFDVNRTSNNGMRISKEICNVFANFGHLTLMNHPDMNFHEFIGFISDYIPKDISCLTLSDVASWWKNTHTACCFNIQVRSAADTLNVTGLATSTQINTVMNIKLLSDMNIRELKWENVKEPCIKLIFGQQYLSFTLSMNSMNGYWLFLST